jgi:pimeloyl-ACP methyl ester carboxylesterase
MHLAYQVLGSGPPNLLVVGPGPNAHVDHAWMEPSLARFLRRLASFSRLIVYDNRGIGLSDPVPGGAAPSMDEQVDDIRAILDETGCQQAVLAGNSAGCAPAGAVRGIAVHTGARVAALADPGEILVSRTIRDLVAGAPVRLDSRGEHELKGVPGS